MIGLGSLPALAATVGLNQQDEHGGIGTKERTNFHITGAKPPRSQCTEKITGRHLTA